MTTASEPVATPARPPTGWPGRLAMILTLAWLGYRVLQFGCSGRWAPWTFLDLLPPFLLLVVPVVLLASAVPLLRMSTRTRLVIVLSAVVALAGGAGQAGVNWVALFVGGDGPAPAGAIRVASWDTLYWDQTDDPSRFYAYLTAQHADVYLLQEYVFHEPDRLVPVDDTARLAAAFPGFRRAVAGELLTLSRFPIIRSFPLDPNAFVAPGTPNPDLTRYRVLRTDIDVDGHVLSVYNVHMPDVLNLDPGPLSARFYDAETQLWASREDELAALHADIARNPNPVLVSGDTNTLPDMGDQRWFAGLTDAARAGGPLYPATMAFDGLTLWRMDWTLTTPAVHVHSYGLVDPQGMSTHTLQNVVVSLAAGR